MLEVYMYEPERQPMLTRNNEYFDLNRANMVVDEKIKDIMMKIDGATYVSNKDIKSKFGGSVIDSTRLSSGCKTVINVYMNPELLIDTTLCGNNALEEIFKLHQGKIYLRWYPLLFLESVDVNLHYEADGKFICEYFSDTDKLSDKLAELLG